MLYYMLNKPRGCITAKTDAYRTTVMDCFPVELRAQLHPVGRLDKDTEGLLLFTDDGLLDNRLLQPSRHITKQYYFRAFGVLDNEKAVRLSRGVPLGDGSVYSKPAHAQLLPPSTILGSADFLPSEYRAHYLKNPDRPVACAYLWIAQGRKHQVKLMVKAVGCHVFYLKRVAIGALRLDDTLRPGEYRALTQKELALLTAAQATFTEDTAQPATPNG